MRRERKRILQTLVSIMLIFAMLIHPSTGFNSKAATATTVNLTSLKYTDCRNSFDRIDETDFKNGFVTKNNVAYRTNFIFFDAGRYDPYVTYNLAGNYTKLEGTITTCKDTGEGVFEADFYGDGKLIKQVKYINDEFRSTGVTVNVTKVKTLKIAVKKTSGSGAYGFVFFANGKLTKATNSGSGTSSGIVAPTVVDNVKTNKKLQSIKVTRYNQAGVEKKGATSYSGKKYKDNAVWFDASQKNSYVEFNLNKKYSKLVGKLIPIKQTGKGVYAVYFYGDGKLIKKYSGISRKKSLNVSISVKNVKKLKIKAVTTSGDKSSGFVALVDGKLGAHSLVFDKTSVVLGIRDGNYYMPVSKYQGKKISNADITWASSNKDVAKVSKKGKIVAVGSGVCVITGTYKKETTSIIVYGKPGKVQNVKLKTQSTDLAQFTWTKQSTATGYIILGYDEDLEEFDEIKTIEKSNVSSVTVKGLKPNKTYRFKVQAYFIVDGKKYIGEASDELVIKTLAD